MIYRKLKKRFGMPCCKNLLKHDGCSQKQKKKYAEEGYIV